MASLIDAIIAGGILPERAALVIREAQRTGLPLPMACVMLMKESEGGKNVYGHDRGTCFSVPGKTIYVTRENYQEYLACVAREGKRNGVGPCQLTWIGYQTEADRRGGCHDPRINIEVGFESLAGHFKRFGPWEAFKRYNGAATYADAAMKMMPRWEWIIVGAGETQRRTLKLGDTGEDVKELQRRLNEVNA